MTTDHAKPVRYPLLETVLAHKGFPLKGTYTIGDVARLFDVSTRTIQVRVKRAELQARDLPGRARFLACDLEQFLQNSSKAAPAAS